MTTVAESRLRDVDDQLGLEPVVGDAVGVLYRRCWQFGCARDVAIEVVERDDGFIIGRDSAIYFDPQPLWPALERAAVARAAGRVLDIGCGPGRHALALTEGGYDAVGIDSSPGAVEVARERGVDAVVGDLFDPPADLGTFDTFLMLGNSISLLGNPDGSRRALARLAAMANPGARLLASGLDVPTSPERDAYEKMNRERGRPHNHASMRIRDRRLATPWFDFLMLGPDDIPAIVHGSAWEIEDVVCEGINYTVELTLRS